jgi:hypothetical protein
VKGNAHTGDAGVDCCLFRLALTCGGQTAKKKQSFRKLSLRIWLPIFPNSTAKAPKSQRRSNCLESLLE